MNTSFAELNDKITAYVGESAEVRARVGCEVYQKIKNNRSQFTKREFEHLQRRVYIELLGLSPHTLERVITDAQAINDRMTIRADTSKGAYLRKIQEAYNYTIGNMKENTMNVKHIWTQVKAGYVGQITVNGTIVWESTPKKNPEKALAAADKHAAKVTARLFA